MRLMKEKTDGEEKNKQKGGRGRRDEVAREGKDFVGR